MLGTEKRVGLEILEMKRIVAGSLRIQVHPISGAMSV